MNDKYVVTIIRECTHSARGMAYLRDALGIGCEAGWQMQCLDALADMVERDYMCLPVDADGVPIHVGDEMQYRGGEPFTVCAVAPGVIHTWAAVKLGERKTTYDYAPDQCTHYKPRTLEDVLREFTEKYQYCISDDGRAITLVKYADELRGMGGWTNEREQLREAVRHAREGCGDA